MRTHSRGARRLAGPALVLLGLLCGAAHGSVGGWGKGGGSLGDDDVGSLPSTVKPDDPSLLLLGTLADLKAVILGVQGPGDLQVHRLGPDSDRMILELEGTLSVALDARVLASGRVETLFGVGTTFADGTASAYTGGSWSPAVALPPFAVADLPLSVLAASGSAFALHAEATTGQVFTLWSGASGSVLHVGQVVRSVD